MQLKSKKIIIIIGVIVILVTILITVFLSMSKSLKVGFVTNTIKNGMSASFARFDGEETKKINLDQGDQLVISYELKTESGTLKIQIVDAENETVFSETGASGEFELLAEETQDYEIQVLGEKAKGSYLITWDKVEN